MCQFVTRVYRCGHYQKALRSVCPNAKREMKICEGKGDITTTSPGYCNIYGCDKKPQNIREGPGKLRASRSSRGHAPKMKDGRQNGGFDADEVDWEEVEYSQN